MKGFWLIALSFTFGFMSCKDKIKEEKSTTSNSIQIKGSNTELDMVKAMSERFKISNDSSFTFEIQGGGSNNGIEALKNGEVSMINSSRKLTPLEYQYFHKNNIEIQEVIFALDAIAIIMHPSIGIDSLTINEISSIFSGEIKNWSELGGKDNPINLYGRNNSSGTFAYMKDRLFGNQGDFSAELNMLDDHQEILHAVESDSNAIGYVDLSTVRNEKGMPYPKVWVPSLSIEGQNASSPFEVNAIENEDYPLTRPLFQFVKLPMTKSEKAFIQFELSDEGQEVVRKFGFYPILSIHRHINSEAGI